MITLQEVQDTTGVIFLVLQAIRTPRGLRIEWQISRRGVRSHLGPVFRMEKSISSPPGINLVRSGRS